MDNLNQWIILLEVLGASFLAGIVGFEREHSNKPAGFRTHMIVGAATCLMMSLGGHLIEQFTMLDQVESLRIDPTRIIEAIVVGVSFIGAGTILKSESKEKIRYLTTAATILLSAAIGISVALNQYILAVGTSLLALIINTVLNLVEKKFKEKRDN